MLGVVIPFAGLPDVTRQVLEQFPSLKIHNLHHNHVAVAEMTFALMLACSRKLIESDKVKNSVFFRLKNSIFFLKKRL